MPINYDVEYPKLRMKYSKALQRIEQLEALCFTAYCAGYELARNDTVEFCYLPPSEHPEEWPEKLAELEQHQRAESNK